MNKSESITNLAKALAEFQKEIKNPANTAINPHFNSKYAPLSEILNEIRPLLSKHGLSVIQSPGGDGEKVSMTTLLMHTSGEWIETDPLILRADKPTAQGAGSGITYARRYTLSALLGISSEDDDDGNTASKGKPPEESRAGQKPTGQKPKPEAPKPANTGTKKSPRTDLPADALACHVCEAPITPAMKTLSEKKYGRPLCPKHQREADESA